MVNNDQSPSRVAKKVLVGFSVINAASSFVDAVTNPTLLLGAERVFSHRDELTWKERGITEAKVNRGDPVNIFASDGPEISEFKSQSTVNGPFT